MKEKLEEMKSLTNKKVITELFVSGKKLYTPTINAKFIKGNPEVMISVPIRLFRKAVDRNRIKRIIREIVRNKTNSQYSIALIYNSNKIEDTKDIERDINKIFLNFSK